MRMNKKDQHTLTKSSGHPQKDCFGVEGEASDEISLKELILKLHECWKYLLRKWVIILISGMIGGIAGVVYAQFKKPVYVAELTFVLEGGKQGGGLGNYASLASQFGIDIGGSVVGGVFEGQNLLALMVSRTMIEKTLLTTVDVKGKKKTLAEFYIDINQLRKKWVAANSKQQNIQFLPGANPSEFSLEQNSLISSFYGTLIADNLIVGTKDKKSSILSIKVISEDELFSKYFAEVLAKEVSDFYIESKIKKSLKNVNILQHQADSVRREFNAAIFGVASSIDANPNANPSRQSLGVPSQSRQVDAQANQAMLIELMRNLAVSQIALRQETPLIQIIDKPILPLPSETFTHFKGLVVGIICGGFVAVFLFLVKKILEVIMA